MTARWVLVLIAVAAALIPLDPATVERSYSTSFYLSLQSIVTPAANRIPIALLDVAAAILLACGAVAYARRTRSVGMRRAAVGVAGSTVSVAAALYLLFLGLWGLNYRRVPLEGKLEYDHGRVTRARAIALANAAAASINRGYSEAHAGAPDATSLARSFADVQISLGASRTAVPGVPKRSLATLYFRRAAIDGMTDPFFLEIIINPEVLPIERPFVLAHEWAHLAGYANESEANFVAWLTCLRGAPLARYSGWVAAYEHAAAVLSAEERRALTPLDAGPREDLRAIAARYARSSPAVRQAARGVYDGYLRANRVPEGIGSYDAVLRLMIGTEFDPGWMPRLK